MRPTNLSKEIHDDHRHYGIAELAEKGADVDVLRQMVQFMAQRLMELDVEGRCGAAYDEKTPSASTAATATASAPGTRAPAASS